MKPKSILSQLPNMATKFLMKYLEALLVFANPKTIGGTGLAIKNLCLDSYR